MFNLELRGGLYCYIVLLQIYILRFELHFNCLLLPSRHVNKRDLSVFFFSFCLSICRSISLFFFLSFFFPFLSFFLCFLPFVLSFHSFIHSFFLSFFLGLENRRSLVLSPARPIFFPRIDDSHCDRIHSSPTVIKRWSCEKRGHWSKELQESMDRRTGRCNN